MFKKTLVALALAGLSTSALAVDLATNTTAQTLSVEGVAANVLTANEASATGVTLTLGAEYTAGDTVTFTISGGEFADAGYSLGVLAGQTLTNNKTVTWGLLNATATTLTFRATDVTTNGTGVDGTSTVQYLLEGTDTNDQLSVKVTSIAKDGKVALTASAKTSTNITIDDQGTKNSGAVFTGVKQLEAEITKGEGKVDVSEERLAFETLSDTKFKVAYVENPATIGDITLATTDVTISGNFTGVASLTELGADNAIGGAGGDADTALKIAEDKMSATMTLTGAARELNFVFALPAAKEDKVALVAPQDFKATIEAKYNSVSSKLATDAVVSSWKLNGASKSIEFMPFASQYAQSVTVTNSGTVEGAITLDFVANGKLQSKTITTVAKAKSVTDISADVKAAAAEFGITGDAKVVVVVNSPAADIEVAGVYYSKKDADRVKTR